MASPDHAPAQECEKIGLKFDLFLFCFDSYIHECSIDVIGALSIDGDQEGEAAVRGQDVHAAILLMVPGQQGDAAVLHPQRGSHHIQSLSGGWSRIITQCHTDTGRYAHGRRVC